MSEQPEWNDHQPKCPVCGFEDQDWWDGLSGGEEEVEWDCACGARLVSGIEYSAAFLTKVFTPDEPADDHNKAEKARRAGL